MATAFGPHICTGRFGTKDGCLKPATRFYRVKNSPPEPNWHTCRCEEHKLKRLKDVEEVSCETMENEIIVNQVMSA